MMRRQNSDPTTVIHSSIALLQERFRKLERVKEMREERQLLRGFAAAIDTDPLSPSPNSHCNHHQQPPPKWFYHPDLVRPSRPLTAPPFAHLHGTRSEFQPFDNAQLSMPLRPDRPASMHTSTETDVDTSLHL